MFWPDISMVSTSQVRYIKPEDSRNGLTREYGVGKAIERPLKVL